MRIIKTVKTIMTIGLISLLSTSISQAHTINEQYFSMAMKSADRATKDKERDANRKPEQVMEFFGIKPGMTVLEILSSGGYYTEILSHRVGETGKVYAQNNQFILEVMNGRFAKEFSTRTANNRLSNVIHHKTELNKIGLVNQVDAATIILNYHDFYSLMSKPARLKILTEIKASLKPGGILGLIDMESGTIKHNKDLHRIHHQIVRDELKEVGFLLDAEAYFLKNEKDDYNKMVFEPSVRGNTDRFVFRFKA